VTDDPEKHFLHLKVSSYAAVGHLS